MLGPETSTRNGRHLTAAHPAAASNTAISAFRRR